MYNTRLNEFEEDQLDFFLAMVEDKLDLLKNSMNRVGTWPKSETKSRLIDMYIRQQSSAILLQVQLENAKSDLKQMVTNNQ